MPIIKGMGSKGTRNNPSKNLWDYNSTSDS